MKQEEHPTEKVPGPTLRKVAEKLYQCSAARVGYYARFRHKSERIIQALGSRNDPCTSLPEAKRLLREHRNKLDRLERLDRRKTFRGLLLSSFLCPLSSSNLTD
jgi:hypothetical protein